MFMYVKYIGGKKYKFLTKDKIYKVLQKVENYYFSIIDDQNIETIFEQEYFRIFPVLKVKYIGVDTFSLRQNKIYEVISIETGFNKNDSYRIIDETEGDYLFNSKLFETIEDNSEYL